MSKRSHLVRCAVLALLALVTASVLAASTVLAADAPGATNLKGQKPKAQPAATAPAPTAPKSVKTPKAPKPAKPPEKPIEEQRAEDGLWAKRTSWLSVRAGYAKATGDFAGDGVVGYGIAYQHMMNRRWSIGGSVNHDIVGHLGYSSEVSVPFTLELDRHFRWDTAIRPYVGLGGGYYFHKYYRTPGGDSGSPGTGVYVNFGGNMAMDTRHILGLDTRVAFVQTTNGAVNGVFGTQKANETLWTIKLNWGFGYY